MNKVTNITVREVFTRKYQNVELLEIEAAMYDDDEFLISHARGASIAHAIGNAVIATGIEINTLPREVKDERENGQPTGIASPESTSTK